MKRALPGVMSALMLTQSLVVYAETQKASPGVNLIPGMSKGNTDVYADSGEYDIKNTRMKIDQMFSESLAQLKGVQDIDREYIKSLQNKYVAELNELARLKAEFQKMSLQSQAGIPGKTGMDKFVKLSDYLQLVIEINNKDQVLRNDLATLSLLTRESLPSYSPITIDGKVNSVATSGNLNTKPIVDAVEAKRAQIIADMNAMTFKGLVAARNGIVNVQGGALTPDVGNVAVLEIEERDQLSNQIQDLNQVTESTNKLNRLLVDKIVSDINKYVVNYGTSEWLRFRDDNDAEAAKEAYLNIADSFMRRSYLRKKFKIRTGAIQMVDYTKIKLGWEQFGLQYQPLKLAVQSLRREAAIEQEDVKQAFENARNFLQMYDEKTTAVFGGREAIMSKDVKSDKYASKDTGFLVRVNSAMTFATGQRNTAEVLLAIMRLVLADAREEMMLIRNANDELASFNDLLYRSTDQMKTKNNIAICQMDWTIPAAVFNKMCPPLGIKNQAKPVATPKAGSSTAEIFSALINRYQNVEVARWQSAQDIQKRLDADSLYGANASRANDEAEDLFK